MASYATEKKLGVTYIYLDGHESGTAAKTLTFGPVNMDLDANGQVIGVELLEALEPVVGYEHV